MPDIGATAPFSVSLESLQARAFALTVDDQEELLDKLLDSVEDKYLLLTNEDEEAIERAREEIRQGKVIPLREMLRKLNEMR